MQGKRYLGNDTHKKELRKKFSKVKKNLVQRIYNVNDPSYKYYGGDGVTMDVGWKNDLNKFIADVIELPGYDEGLFLSGNLSLDKDYIGDSKTYNRECCSWVSKETNNKYKPHQQIEFTIINTKTGIVVGTFFNQSEAARIIDTYQANISKALRTGKPYKYYQITYTNQ